MHIDKSDSINNKFRGTCVNVSKNVSTFSNAIVIVILKYIRKLETNLKEFKSDKMEKFKKLLS